MESIVVACAAALVACTLKADASILVAVVALALLLYNPLPVQTLIERSREVSSRLSGKEEADRTPNKRKMAKEEEAEKEGKEEAEVGKEAEKEAEKEEAQKEEAKRGLNMSSASRQALLRSMASDFF